MTDCIGDNTVVEFIEGKLAAAEVARVERHLTSCEVCRLRVVGVGTSPSRIGAAPTPAVNADAPVDLCPGSRVGRFTVLRELGRGGMGVVFAAWDPELQRSVAIKLLRSAMPWRTPGAEPHRHLLDEARAMARLDHSNIVTVHEVGTSRDETYIVMELVDGVTLSDWLRRPARAWTAVLAMFYQAGQGLAHAHAHGLAHGDFKPDNVLVDGRERVKVTDFGLSRQLSPAAERAGDGEPMLMGTPRYMAPEQFRGQPSDPRSDQFGFCVALYEALYGQHPFAHDTPLSLLRLPLDQAVRPAPGNTAVPARLRDALRKGLSLDPALRHGSMSELLAELAALSRPRRRRGARLPATAALAVVCSLGYGLGAWTTPATQMSGPGALAGPRQLPRGPQRSAAAPGTRLGREPGSEPTHHGDTDPAHRADAESRSWLARVFATAGTERVSLMVREVYELAAGQRPIASGPGRHDARPGNRDEPSRAGARFMHQVRRSVDRRWHELEICFREWRERQPAGTPIYAVGLRIDPGGRARVHQHRGLSDRVVKECVAGVLEAVSYPQARATSEVEVVFRSDGNTLRIVRLGGRAARASP